jgi:hypothetical protein
MKRYLAALVICLAGLPAMAQVQQATIYFVPWEIATRSALSADDVRRLAYVRTEILNPTYVNSFVQSLEQQPLEKTPITPLRDIRLVVDIQSQSGATRTITANRFDLFDEASGSVRKLDEKFRDRFSLGAR